jgi:hypothetical protein
LLPPVETTLLLALYAVGNFFTDPKYAGYWWIR